MKKISHSRRGFLRASAALPLVWLASALKPIQAFAAEWPKALFQTATPTDAIKQLQAQKALPGNRILLEVPDIADNTEHVPVRVMTTLPAVEQITIVVDMALRPVVAQFNLAGEAEPDVTTYVKLPAQSTVRAVVKAAGGIYSVSHEVKLAAEPWTGPIPPLPTQAPSAGKAQPKPKHKAGKA